MAEDASIETKKGPAVPCLVVNTVPGMPIILPGEAEEEVAKRTKPGPCAIQGPVQAAITIKEHYFRDTVQKVKLTGTISWQSKILTGPEDVLEVIKYFTVKSFFNPDKPSGFFIFTP